MAKTRKSLPGELEQTVLLALAASRHETTGGEIYDLIVDTTGRDLSIAAVYITLARLDEKGWVDVRAQPPEPGQGGKPRKYYALSPAGGQTLSEARRRYEALWRGAANHRYVKPGTQGKQ